MDNIEQEFQTSSLWTASFLVLNNVPLLRTETLGDSYLRFIFSNQSNIAHAFFHIWRHGSDAYVNGPKFAEVYRKLLTLAHEPPQVVNRV